MTEHIDKGQNYVDLETQPGRVSRGALLLAIETWNEIARQKVIYVREGQKKRVLEIVAIGMGIALDAAADFGDTIDADDVEAIRGGELVVVRRHDLDELVRSAGAQYDVTRKRVTR